MADTIEKQKNEYIIALGKEYKKMELGVTNQVMSKQMEFEDIVGQLARALENYQVYKGKSEESDEKIYEMGNTIVELEKEVKSLNKIFEMTQNNLNEL